MEEKKVVSIEERIPKLKQIRKKKANRRLVQYLSILFVLIAIVVYLQSPLSHVNHVEITGNRFVDEREIRDLAAVGDNSNIWQLDPAAISEEVSKHDQVLEAKVSRSLPSTIVIEVTEADRIGYRQTDGNFQPILENGAFLDSTSEFPSGDAPILKGFSKETYLEEMAQALKKVPDSITGLISEIHYSPTDDNPYLIKLYMNDGYEVQASIRTFSEKILAYPSIASQIEEGQKGIIHIDVGAYFEAYEDEDSESEEDSENVEDPTQDQADVLDDNAVESPEEE
ncbi:cell division protein FtsQ/DivIB [Halobacillus sp. Marseille-Q1614]|uniref:cell division protein FtsQ/DivIB n=1 Tax=Halobacillus sp. Marseille-Q1614 TaxID=2709134 RepID=UPI0015711B19|nr:FtsQ-type POTRA domain-containing protein [Halobacillus sp. Marseille-Q1614]